jgi:preprotein translocase subunit SecY
MCSPASPSSALSGGRLRLPELLISYANVPFYFGGTAAIAVSVTMDTVAQVNGPLAPVRGLIKRLSSEATRR